LAVDTHLPSGTPRPLDRVLRMVEAGPRPFFRAAMVSLAATSVLAAGIVLYVRPHRAIQAPQRDIIAACLAALCVAGVGWLASLVRPAGGRAGLDRSIAPEQRAAIWLALTAWFPALLIVTYYRAKATFPPSVKWINFGYYDKRWVTAAYLVCALAPMLLLVLAARVLKVGRDHPRTWRSWLAGLFPQRSVDEGTIASAAPRSGWLGYARVAAAVLTALALAYYFYGPPWYLSRTADPIGYQEDVFLAGLQAVATGHLPYIGPASLQYGPGAQLLSYFYMRHVSTFSVVGFRQAWATFQWAGASIFFVALVLAFGYLRGLVAALMSALIYPALQAMGFMPGGVYSGFWGWANPLRYAGAISLIVLLPAVIRRSPSWRGFAGGAALGLVWGGLSYVAQENLIGGAIGALAVSALLLFSGTASGRAVRTALLGVLAGFLLVWLPVLVFYAVHGALGRFLYLYFLITEAVASGYSNTPFGGFTHSGSDYVNSRPWVHMFYLLPVVLAILALLTVVQFRPFRIAEEWPRERTLLAAITVTTILLYQGALLRSDTPHLTGTLLVVPALVIVVATVLPRLCGARQRPTLALAGIALFAASFLLLPAKDFGPASIREHLEAPYRDRQRLAAKPAASPPTTVAGQRVGAGLLGAATCCQGSTWSMPRFITLMNQIHAIVGSRTAYVVSIPAGYPGLVYFVADLNPAPISLDPYTLVMNEPQLTAFLANFRTSVLPRTQAVITPSLSAPEARLFLHRYKHYRLVTLSYLGSPLYVLISS
jgi:hypothetical protein